MTADASAPTNGGPPRPRSGQHPELSAHDPRPGAAEDPWTSLRAAPLLEASGSAQPSCRAARATASA